MPNSLKELAELIAKRDDISMNEAWNLVSITQEEITAELNTGNPSCLDIENILADNLGLEPDYLELFIW